MYLSEQAKKLYEKICLYNRFESLSKKFPVDLDTLEKYSIEEAKSIIENLGYTVRFIKKETFFKVEQVLGDYEFHYHISLKWGHVELIIGGKNTKSGISEGSVFGDICQRIDLEMGVSNPPLIKKPGFRNYDELTEILKEAFDIYEDFKTEFMKIYV